jgi:hypothetical protein
MAGCQVEKISLAARPSSRNEDPKLSVPFSRRVWLCKDMDENNLTSFFILSMKRQFFDAICRGRWSLAYAMCGVIDVSSA